MPLFSVVLFCCCSAAVVPFVGPETKSIASVSSDLPGQQQHQRTGSSGQAAAGDGGFRQSNFVQMRDCL
jgi:hypothetical protein